MHVALTMMARRRWSGVALAFALVVAWTVILVSYVHMAKEPYKMLQFGKTWHRPVVGGESQRNASLPIDEDPMALVESMANVHTFAPLQPNILPIYNITVGLCYPVLGCFVHSRSDNMAGDWVRVERPLSAHVAEWRGTSGRGGPSKSLSRYGSPYLFYRRALERHGEHIVEVSIVPRDAPLPETGRWHRVAIPSAAPFRKAKEHEVRFRTEMDAKDAITELDMMYGPNPPPPGFAVAATLPPVVNKDGKVSPRAALIIRRKVERTPRAPPLRFHADGSFKILQLADLHFSVEELACRDVEDVARCQSQNDTLALVERWLDEEKPDLVVFTGDQLNGQGTSWDEHSVMPGWLIPVVRRKIPWLPLFGNHDSESGFLTRREQMELLALYPYSLAQVGPRDVHGAGNYDVAVHAPAPDNTELLTLWSLDSGAHPSFSVLRPWEVYLYDWVHSDQVQWMVHALRSRVPIPWPYKPKAQPPAVVRSRRAPAQRPPGIVFVHIPLPEAFDKVDTDASGKELRVGVREERYARLGGQARRGVFDAMLAERNAETPSVRLYVHGHMHNNEDCRRVRGVWICFGGGVSYAAYGKVGFARRARVYRITDFGQTTTTWHRRDDVQGRVEETVLG